MTSTLLVDYDGDAFRAVIDGAETIVLDGEREMFRLPWVATFAQVFAALVAYHLGVEDGIKLQEWVETHRAAILVALRSLPQ